MIIWFMKRDSKRKMASFLCTLSWNPNPHMLSWGYHTVRKPHTVVWESWSALLALEPSYLCQTREWGFRPSHHLAAKEVPPLHLPNGDPPHCRPGMGNPWLTLFDSCCFRICEPNENSCLKLPIFHYLVMQQE